MNSIHQTYLDQFADRIEALVSSAHRLDPIARRLKDAGLRPESVRDYAGLIALPVQSKDEVRLAQLADPPFGGLLSAEARPRRIFQSPGPLYEPQLDGDDPWRWGQALAAIGIGSRDVVMNCFGYHLSPAGVMFDEACGSVGAGVVPGGIGSAELQARAVHDLPLTAYVGLPSYLKVLIDSFKSADLDPQRWEIHRAVVSAEPLPDTLREELKAAVPHVISAYGTAEAGLIGYEDAPGAGLIIPEGVLVEICDPISGEPVYDREGQIVVTLFRQDYPMIRFGTGDISAWVTGTDGTLRLAGVLGRVGDGIKVRGMFLQPDQAYRHIAGRPGVGQFRLVVDRVDHRDSLTVEVVLEDGADERTTLNDVRSRVRDGLRFACDVVAVPSLAESSGSIVDHRDWK